MKSKNRLYPLLVVAMLAAAGFACGEDNTGKKVDETQSEGAASAPELKLYEVGDVIQVQDHTIVLNSAVFTGDQLEANFTIENKGTTEIVVSSMMSFRARDSEGTNLTLTLGCGPGPDGSVLPGDKLRGSICWAGAATETVKIYYEANLFGSGAVVWEVKK